MSTRRLRGVLDAVGVQPGRVVFVHSSLSALGYLPDGPAGVLRAIIDAVGPGGTVLMPSFAPLGAMEEHLATAPTFDVMRTPSANGALTEAFRRWPGVVRSLHPTHSVAAFGRLARDLTEGHERCEGPCGLGTPFDRLAPANALLLRLGTGTLTLRHHVQERLALPELFLPEPAEVVCRSAEGREVKVRVRVYRKEVWNVFFLGADEGGQRMAVHARDFPLLYSGRDHLYQSDPTRQKAFQQLLSIRAEFERAGWLRMTEANGARIEAFEVQPFLDVALGTGQSLVAAHAARYDLQALERMLAAGLYPR